MTTAEHFAGLREATNPRFIRAGSCWQGFVNGHLAELEAHVAELEKKLADARPFWQIHNERDTHGDLTDFALAAGALIDAGCDCGTDEPGTCLGCVCERALKSERTRAITAEQRIFELEKKLADAESATARAHFALHGTEQRELAVLAELDEANAKLAKALASATSMVP